MALVENEQFHSLETKTGNLMTMEEERDHYRKRFQSMKLVLREMNQQLTLYKTRCSGVNTIALMLQESKQEVVKLTKQRKALETAITNLQNRLSTNGLSSSVNIEENELFVPGASKQTLDNLAKENARLRALLKSNEGHTGRRSSEDMQRMTVLLEKLEAENVQLRAQLLEIGHLKVSLTIEYEDEIKKIKGEKLQLEQELSQYHEEKVESPNNNETISCKVGLSKACQTLDLEPSKIDEVRQALKLLTDHCVALDQSLENLQITAKNEMNNETSPTTDKDNIVSKEAYQELKLKVTQVVQMNQRWQVYNENQEQQIHGLVAKIAELEGLNKEFEELRIALDTKEIENQNLQREIANLTREVNRFRSQPQFDISLVEILKQQIQVCTEDFNTERKDREHAVNKAKHLQEEVNKLKNENEGLKRETDNLQKIKNAQEMLNLTWMRPQQILPHYNPRSGSIPPQRIPFSSSSSGIPPPMPRSLSPVPSPVPMSFSSSSSTSDRSSYYPSSSQDSVSGFQTYPRGLKQQTGQPSFPRARGPQESPPTSNLIQKPTTNTASMPTLSVKAEEFSNGKQPDLTCPKCSKEFSENQQSELINHIDTCPE